jgi:hypothetical protein
MENATNVSAGLRLIFISEKLTAVIIETALVFICFCSMAFPQCAPYFV